ncbi:MAG: VanZ family protein [Candidatus Saccharimonadaceae bacterium]
MSSYFRYTIIPGIVALIIFYVTCIINVDSIPGSKRLLQYDKIAHFGMFFIFSAVIYYDYYRMHGGKPNLYKWVLFGLIVPVIYGGIIEIAQQQFFSRSGDLQDFIADIFGSLSATVVALFYLNLKREQ